MFYTSMAFELTVFAVFLNELICLRERGVSETNLYVDIFQFEICACFICSLCPPNDSNLFLFLYFELVDPICYYL